MNSINIVPTKFENIRTGTFTFGWRAYDNLGQAYDNSLSSIPDDDLDFLEAAISTGNDDLNTMLDFLQENQEGIYIDSEYYDWGQIRDIVDNRS